MTQTTRRYAFSKSFAQIILYSMQFFLIFGKLVRYQIGTDFWMVYFGYFLMLCFFVVRGHNSKVYLRYEAGLSLIIKTITINVMLVFFLGALPEFDFFSSVAAVFIFTILNLITLILINCLGNVVLRRELKDQQEMLYIYGETAVVGEGKWISADLPIEELEKQINQHESVYLVDIHSQQRNLLMKIWYDKGKLVYITTKLSDILIKASGITQDVDTPVYYCERFGIGRNAEFLKRSFDIVCSLFALIVLSPFFLVIAILIKKEDGGPVFYSQVRCTKDQKEFKIYKFRSMTCDSEKDGARLSEADDQRVTKIGKFIRYTKIDELPQLINILKGEMSIVGPRPERPELIKETIKNVPEFALRMKVKAGLTGYAQVRGYYNTEFLDKLKWDLMYIENYSFLLDIKIIIMTVFVIFQNNIRKEREE